MVTAGGGGAGYDVAGESRGNVAGGGVRASSGIDQERILASVRRYTGMALMG